MKSGLLFLTALPLLAQSSLYVVAGAAKEYVVGAKLAASGLFRQTPTNTWEHLGYTVPFMFGLDYDPNDPSIIYMAAGNGLIRGANGGKDWTLVTGSDITELRDLVVTPTAIYIAHSRGIRVSKDRGKTWAELSGKLHRKFTEALRVDRTNPSVLLAGGEEGVFRSEDGGQTWKPSGAGSYQIAHLEQSPHDPATWLAATQGGGVYISRDGGKTFESPSEAPGVGRNLYDVAFDPTNPNRMAVGGWGPGVTVSEDGGKTWAARNVGLPRPDVSAIIFDPTHSGRIYASVHEEAIFVSDDVGKSWKPSGMEGRVGNRMKFIPGGSK